MSKKREKGNGIILWWSVAGKKGRFGGMKSPDNCESLIKSTWEKVEIKETELMREKENYKAGHGLADIAFDKKSKN